VGSSSRGQFEPPGSTATVELSVAQHVVLVMVCLLGGVGTAGVPAESIRVVALILGMAGVPIEDSGLILGVDRFLDMCRTTPTSPAT
jgi:DAACS family dicarboxylate/amino acid:cation (Na+ or H+) symporter